MTFSLVRHEVLMAVTIKITAFWDEMPYSLTEFNNDSEDPVVSYTLMMEEAGLSRTMVAIMTGVPAINNDRIH